MNRLTTVLLFGLLFLVPLPGSGQPIRPLLARSAESDEPNPLDDKARAKAKLALQTSSSKQLAKEKLEVAKTCFESRFKEFLAGRGTLDFLFSASKQWLESERALATKETDLEPAFERHWELMKQIEDVNKARYEAGRIAVHEYLETKYYRLEAEIWLLEARQKKRNK